MYFFIHFISPSHVQAEKSAWAERNIIPSNTNPWLLKFHGIKYFPRRMRAGTSKFSVGTRTTPRSVELWRLGRSWRSKTQLVFLVTFHFAYISFIYSDSNQKVKHLAWWIVCCWNSSAKNVFIVAVTWSERIESGACAGRRGMGLVKVIARI